MSERARIQAHSGDQKHMKNKLFERITITSFILSLFAGGTILCFLFPEYLTTPEVRSNYPIDLIRNILYISCCLGLLGTFVGLLFTDYKKLSFTSLLVWIFVITMGGHNVPLSEDYQSFQGL